MPEDSKHELPALYAPLVKYVSTKFPEQMSAFESAFRRIEGRRLSARQKLRKTLQSYWSATDEQLKNLSPLDVVHYFEAYAEEIFRGAGEICLGLFNDSEAYGDFLQAVQDWILDAMLPDPETFEGPHDDLVALAGEMLKQAETKGLDHPLVRDLAASITKFKLEIQNPMASKLLRKAIDRARIIDLRESFSAFEARQFWNNRASPSGDWGVFVNSSMWDALLTEGLSAGAHSAVFETIVALSDATNRESARCIWMVALEQLQDALLGAWWEMSADARAEEQQIAPARNGDDAITVLAQMRSEWLEGKLAGKYSEVDLGRTKKITYGTIKRYQSGASIRATTRRGLSDALNVLGISCEYNEVPL